MRLRTVFLLIATLLITDKVTACPPPGDVLNVVTTVFGCQTNVDRASCMETICPEVQVHEECTSTIASLVSSTGGSCQNVATPYYSYECDYTLGDVIKSYCNPVRCPAGAQDVNDLLVLVDCGFLPKLEGLVQGGQQGGSDLNQDSKCLEDRGACGAQSSATMLRFQTCTKSIQTILTELFAFYNTTAIPCESIMDPPSRCSEILGRELTGTYCNPSGNGVIYAAIAGGVAAAGIVGYIVVKKSGSQSSFARYSARKYNNYTGGPAPFTKPLPGPQFAGSNGPPTAFSGRSRVAKPSNAGPPRGKIRKELPPTPVEDPNSIIWNREMVGGITPAKSSKLKLGKPTMSMMR